MPGPSSATEISTALAVGRFCVSSNASDCPPGRNYLPAGSTAYIAIDKNYVNSRHPERNWEIPYDKDLRAMTLEGIFGPPRDLVTSATMRLCNAIEALQPRAPVKLVLMSSVSVHRAGGLDARRGSFERALLWMLRGVLPPARDNQRAADFLQGKVGPHGAFVQWVVVRPDSLREGEVSDYAVHEGLVNGLFAPGSTNMANVAHFMCELVTNPKTWADWKGKLPVITNAEASSTLRGPGRDGIAEP